MVNKLTKKIVLFLAFITFIGGVGFSNEKAESVFSTDDLCTKSSILSPAPMSQDCAVIAGIKCVFDVTAFHATEKTNHIQTRFMSRHAEMALLVSETVLAILIFRLSSGFCKTGELRGRISIISYIHNQDGSKPIM